MELKKLNNSNSEIKLPITIHVHALSQTVRMGSAQQPTDYLEKIQSSCAAYASDTFCNNPLMALSNSFSKG